MSVNQQLFLYAKILLFLDMKKIIFLLRFFCPAVHYVSDCHHEYSPFRMLTNKLSAAVIEEYYKNRCHQVNLGSTCNV